MGDETARDSRPTARTSDQRSREVLDFEREAWKLSVTKERAIRERFGFSPSRYHQLLHRIIDRPEALVYDPMLVRRLAPGPRGEAARPDGLGPRASASEPARPRDPAGRMEPVNPGIARLAIVIALVIGGVALLANGFSDGETAAAPRTTRRHRPRPRVRRPRDSPQPSIVPNQEGVLVQVLNGTSQAGYAGDFQILLEEEGYLRAGEPADAPDKPVRRLDRLLPRGRQQGAEPRGRPAALGDLPRAACRSKPLPATSRTRGRRSRRTCVVVLGEDQAGAA